MNKAILRVFLVFAFVAFFNVKAYAAKATVDTDNVSNGIVTVNLTETTGKIIKAQVEKGTEKYYYALVKSSVNLPLQMGTGEYKITILENVNGDMYKPIAAVTVTASTIDETALYTASIPMAEYSVSTKAIPELKNIADKEEPQDAKIAAVYKAVLTPYSYDYDKAASVKADYVPVIDDVYGTKKGICYDYAATLCGALRNVGIPTRLVMGYAPDISEYHAWNEVLISGEWVAVDATYDSILVDAGYTYTMKRDKTKTKVVKTY